MDPSYNNSFGSSQGPITSGDGSAAGESGFGTGSGAVSSGSSGSRVGGPVPVSSGTGDIILASSGGKKSKKGLIIGILVAAVLVVVGVVVGVVMIGGGQKNNSLLLKSFNFYANYLLYGEESDIAIGDFRGLDFVYYFDKENIGLASDDAELNSVIGYYDKLSGKLGDFVSTSSSSKMSDNERAFVQNYVGAAEAYFELRSKYFLNSEEIRQYYAKNGYNKTKELIDEYYATLQGGSEEIENMRIFLTDAAMYHLNEFHAYTEIGCVNGIDIDYSCPSDIVDFEHDRTILELENAIETVMKNTRKKVLEGCWEIKNEIIR